MIKLSIVGDLFPGGVIVDREDFISQELLDLFKTADIRVATLESAIGDSYPFDYEKMCNPEWRNIVFSPNRSLAKLSKLHIDVVALANNHIYDLGAEGLNNVIDLLDRAGISYCGAGKNIEEASKPAVVSIKGKKIAFLSYMVYFEGWRAPHPASKDRPGLNIFDLKSAVKDIKIAKSKYDYVFILPHWGTEYSYWPTQEDVYYSRQLLKAGADGIFGSHAHVVQPYITIKKKPVFFGMGNFLFPDFYMNIDRTTFYPTSQEEVENLPITYNYERHPQKPMLRKWPENNRQGVVANIMIEDMIRYRVVHIKNSKSNHIEIDENPIYVKTIKKIGFSIKYIPYKLIIRLIYLKRIVKQIFRKIK